MELQQIVERYAEAIEHVDATHEDPGVNRRTGVAYLPGVKSLSEGSAVVAIDEAWAALYPNERHTRRTAVSYPGVAYAACDHVMTTDDPDQDDEEWGIEVKRLQMVGDNGKANDYFVTKVLSPYLKDRGLLHDAARLREYGFTRRIAVIGYSFDYGPGWVREAEERHEAPASRAVIAEVARVMWGNGGALRIRPLIEFADAILRLRGFTGLRRFPWVPGRADRVVSGVSEAAGGRFVLNV